MSYFEYTLPTSAEYENEDIPKLELTAASLAWNPSDDDYALQEESHLNYRGHLIAAARTDGPCWNAGMRLQMMADATCAEEPRWSPSRASPEWLTVDEPSNDCLGVALCNTMQVSLAGTCLSTETYDMCGIHIGKRSGAVDHITLVQISLEQARNTVERKTQ